MKRDLILPLTLSKSGKLLGLTWAEKRSLSGMQIYRSGLKVMKRKMAKGAKLCEN